MSEIFKFLLKAIAVGAAIAIAIELVNKLVKEIRKKRALKLIKIRDEITTGDINEILDKLDRLQKYWRWPSDAISLIRAECFYKQGKGELAISELDKVTGNLVSDALIDKGCIYQDFGNIDLAIECFTKSLSIEPHNPIALMHMGFILFEKKHYDEAEKYLVQFTNMQDFEVAYEKLARIFQEKEQIQNAIDAMKKAVQIHPRSDYFNFLSELYEKIGDRQAASECFLKADKLLLEENSDSY